MSPTFTVLVLVISLYTLSFTKQSNGLSLRMIPVYSKESPLYQPNLTWEDAFRKMIELSDARILGLSSSDPEIVRPHLQFYPGAAYILLIGIGTLPVSHYLLMDTASSLIWVQCVGCNPCFNIRTGSFDYHRSFTFHYVSCDHQLCVPRICTDDNVCEYLHEYEDESTIGGMLAAEKFMFPSSDPQTQFEVVDVVFGCGTNNVVSFDNPNNIISGVFAMGRESQSFISQLGDQGLGRFSYCLPDYKQPEGTVGFLRFGSDASLPGNPVPSSTPFLTHPQAGHSDYYLDMRGISVQGRRLPIPPEAFQFTHNGGGVSIDVGSSMSYLNIIAYNPLEVAVENYFRDFEGVARVNLPGLSLCYRTPQGFKHFPAIRLHFADADWDVRPEAAFVIYQRLICFSIKPNPERITTNILGAYLQSNYQFMYDTRANRLYFEEKVCVNV